MRATRWPRVGSLTPTLAGIRVYPVKSLAGTEVAEVEIEPWGPRHDRRWMLLTPEGDVLTARQAPEMLHLGAIALGGWRCRIEKSGWR